MTSLEHVSVKHALDRLPSWTGNGLGHGDGVEGEVEVEEVGVGVAVTTPDEGESGVGIAVERGSPCAENAKDEHQSERRDRNEHERDHGKGEDRGEDGDGEGTGLGGRRGVGTSRRSSRGASHRGSRSRSDVDSRSLSGSLSRSRSQSSMRGPLEMGASSTATSWTQPDLEGVGGRPSVESERPSQEVRCRSRVDGVGLEEEVIDVVAGEEVGALEDRTEMTSLPHLRPGTTTDGNVSRKEEVLVMQEEDIGEVWDPLRYNGKARSQDEGEGEGEKGEVEEDVGSAHALESAHGGDQFSEMNEKERWRTFGSAGRDARPSRLEFKSPSPQLWDETDPPTDNNETYASDYYSTLNSKKFETLQKRCVCYLGALFLILTLCLIAVNVR